MWPNETYRLQIRRVEFYKIKENTTNTRKYESRQFRVVYNIRSFTTTRTLVLCTYVIHQAYIYFSGSLIVKRPVTKTKQESRNYVIDYLELVKIDVDVVFVALYFLIQVFLLDPVYSCNLEGRLTRVLSSYRLSVDAKLSSWVKVSQLCNNHCTPRVLQTS